jgi:hypothetical protein
MTINQCAPGFGLKQPGDGMAASFFKGDFGLLTRRIGVTIYSYVINFIVTRQADRGCAAGAFFCGGRRGRLDKKGCNASRGATDFREERNPPQADSIGSVFFNRE